MNALKYIARNGSWRVCIGGLASGGVAYALVSGFPPAVFWTAVGVAFFIGALSSMPCETIVEAIVKAVIASVVVFMALMAMHKFVEKHPSSWALGFFSFLVGLLIGMGTGSLLGAVCRLAYDPPRKH
jgi:hypothetical protein